MLKVVFFARIREQLDCPGLALEWQPEFAQLTGLEAFLARERGERWAEVFGQDNLVRAVNQCVVPAGAALADGDEVAFYPPVTGG